MKSSILYTILLLFISLYSFSQNKHDHNAHVDPNDPAHIRLKNKEERAKMKWSSTRPDGHAPIGVMGDHTHHKGGIMFSYRFMNMEMDGNLTSNDEINNTDIYQNYMVAPQTMQMHMHMLGMMYAPSNKLTLMLMANVGVRNQMDLRTKMGMDFSTKSTGLGDISLSGLYQLFNKRAQTLHLNLGLTFPTGSLTEKDDTPMGSNQKLPYPMQIGSGTYDLKLGVTYLEQRDKYSWGAQPMMVIRTGENSEEYRLGNKFNLTAWGAYQLNKWISASFRLNLESIGEISGVDEELNPMMVTTADTQNFGGERVFAAAGMNFMLPGHLRLGLEYVNPVYQKLNGIQMKAKNSFVIGLQYSMGH